MKLIAKTCFILLFAVGSAFAQTQIYRSTQFGKTSALKVGTGINLTISGTTATFASAMPDTVGVGDAIQYDATGLGAITNICFISARTSSTVYTVQDATGGTPTACTNDQDWSIFRAYTSWANVESGTENTGINVTVRGFDAGNENLSSANENWNVACYRGYDTDALDINGWTFNTNNRLTFYSPTSLSEVGLTQRHAGVYPGNTASAVNKTSSISFGSSTINQQVSFQGVIYHMDAVACSGFNFSNANSSSIFELTESILIGRNGSGCSGTTGPITAFSPFSAVLKLRNLILYNVDGSGTNSGPGNHAAIRFVSGDGTIYAYNVTDNNSNYSFFHAATSGTFVVKNNISQNSDTFGFYTEGGASYSAASNYNISDRAADAPGANSKNSTTVTFLNAAGNNFHLDSGDTGAGNSGTDLSADANLPVTTDIDRDARPATFVDMGADEGVAAPTEMDMAVADGDATPSTSDSTDFGTVILGQTRSVTYTITNSGGSALTLSGTPKVAVSGTHSSDFTVTTQPSSPVAASGTTTFVVKFTPSAAGVRSAELSIANDDSNENPYNFSIQGTGSASQTQTVSKRKYFLRRNQ